MRLPKGLPAVTATVLVLIALASPAPSRAADKLPLQLSDAEYWKLVSEYSEPDRYFEQNVMTSNEMSYQLVVPELVKRARTGGAYFGVGPEQNFTYIAAVQPKIAFIFDIRRNMLLEHLMYKSIFEMSANRVEFVANLFSRKADPQLTADSPVRTIFQAFAKVPADTALAEQNLKEILSRLKTRHRFPLTAEDERGIRAIYLTFVREGVLTFHASFLSPGYATLMTLADRAGKNWSFLAANENYDRVRAMHQKNLIVPLVGDFGGPKAIRLAGQYLRDHGATVDVFYISNVEDYISQVWRQYTSNIASLPIDSSSLFVRWYIGGSPALYSIESFVNRERPRQ
jgi:hypothetical protein